MTLVRSDTPEEAISGDLLRGSAPVSERAIEKERSQEKRTFWFSSFFHIQNTKKAI